jgi:hypothetical protein
MRIDLVKFWLFFSALMLFIPVYNIVSAEGIMPQAKLQILGFLFGAMLFACGAGGLVLKFFLASESALIKLSERNQFKRKGLSSNWITYAIIGGIVLLGIVFGTSNSDFSENLPHYRLQ